MITWFQNAVQRHHKILFGILLAVISVAFVFTIGNFGGLGPGDKSAESFEFYGVDLNDGRQLRKLEEEMLLIAELRIRRFNSREQFKQFCLTRLAALNLAEQIQIPNPEEKQLKQLIESLPKFSTNGKFDPKLYKAFVDRLMQVKGSRWDQRFALALLRDWKIQQVLQAIGGSGNVSEEEALLKLENEDTKWSVAVWSLFTQEIIDTIKADEQEVEKFYNENKESYREPEGHKLSWIAAKAEYFKGPFPIPEESKLRALYRKKLGQWKQASHKLDIFELTQSSLKKLKEDKKESAKKDNWLEKKVQEEFESTYQIAREEVLKDYQLSEGLEKAAELIDEIVLELYEAKMDNRLRFGQIKEADLIVEKHHLKRQDLGVLREKKLPTLEGIPQVVLEKALTLDAEHFYSNAFVLENLAGLFFLEKIEPSKIAELPGVLNEVTEDYKEDRAISILRSQGELLEKAVQQGDLSAFKNVEKKVYKDFLLKDPPKELSFSILVTLSSMKKGRVETISNTKEFFVFKVLNKKLASYTFDSPKVDSTRRSLQLNSIDSLQNAVLEEMVQKELENNKN